MELSLEGLIYLVAGTIVVGLYKRRESGLGKISLELLPEFDATALLALKEELRSAYQRAFYLGVSFFYLAFVTIFQRSPQAKVFGILLVVGVFIYNIPPRSRVMRMIDAADLDLQTLRERGLRL